MVIKILTSSKILAAVVFLAIMLISPNIFAQQKKKHLHKKVTTEAPAAPSFRFRTVIIDAGHGGKDPGAHGKYSKEKNIALAIA